MKRKYLIFGLISLVFFALRTIDTVLFINPQTGYFDGGLTAVRIIVLAAAAAAIILAGNRFKNTASVSDANREKNPAVFVFFSLAGVFAAIASLKGLLEISKLVFLAGKVVAVLCSAVGFGAAIWFFITAFAGIVETKKYFGGRYLPVFVIVWYCLRALKEFASAPINHNNSIVLAAIAGELVLAMMYLAFGRIFSIEDNQKYRSAAIVTAAAALIIVIGFELPSVIPLLKAGETTRTLHTAADALGAVGGFLAAAQYVKKEAIKDDEQQKAD